MNREASLADGARALESAAILKQQLEERLIGKTANAWSCGCGACSFGPSKVVGIRISTEYPARWLLWTCDMEDDKGHVWADGLGTYIPWIELYLMFRNHFAGIDVQVTHPYAQLYSDKADDCAVHRPDKERRTFIGSGHTVIVSTQNAAYVRPVGDLTNSVWVNAEIRIDDNLEQYATREPLLACNVDPFEFGQPHGRGAGQYYHLSDPGQMLTFYIPILSHGHLNDVYFPIARLLSVNKPTGEATFELDRSVEST